MSRPRHLKSLSSPYSVTSKDYKWKDDWKVDTDDRSRRCEVTLCTRNLDLEGLAEHWALYFCWEDGYSATYEASKVGEVLTPFWNKGPPKHDGTEKYVHYKSYAITCSPKKINSLAYNNKHNGKMYDLLIMNCHVWVQELCKALKVTLPKSKSFSTLVAGAAMLAGKFGDIF